MLPEVYNGFKRYLANNNQEIVVFTKCQGAHLINFIQGACGPVDI